jgi:hypothetical protein
MRTVLKIAGVGCLTILVAGAILIAVNWDRITLVARNLGAMFDGFAEAQTLRSVDALLDFIDANRSRVSLVAYRLDDPDSAIFLNPDVPRALASTIKILVLAGYAEGVDEGRWSPGERVPLADVEAFFLPGTDGGAHDRAVEVYRERGWLDASSAVSLRDVVWAMMTVSDNAATDYLLHRLGRERAEALPDRLGLGGSDAPLPISGIFLSWADAAEEPLSDAAWELAERLRGDPEFRRGRQDNPMTNEVGVREQSRFSVARSPRGTARDYAGLMERVQRGDLISQTASATMREFLEWPMENEPIRREFTSYGTKGGSLAGVLTEATYAVPRDAAPGGVAALLFEELPVMVWLTLAQAEVRQEVASTEDGRLSVTVGTSAQAPSILHQDLLRRLLTDPEFFESVRRRLEAPRQVGQESVP